MHMLKYMPDHFGRHGFKRPQKVVCAKVTMNVSELEERLEGLMKDGYAVKEGKALKVDLTKMGVDKLLGSGQISTAVDVMVPECTETAKAKVEEAGGHILTP
jgi:large subunit ribosomal protein L15